jgi:predicted nuclease of predicted toxin-antitoxin system
VRVLADENIPLETVRALRVAGHDVYAVSETAAGTSDEALLKVATAEQRLVITFDRDFGELATRGGEAVPSGILLLRFTPRSAAEVNALVVSLLARSDIEWAYHLSVLDRFHLRQRPLRR